MYLYKVYDINKNCVLSFKYDYLTCFEVLDILRNNIDYISCTREKLFDNQICFF